MIDKELIYLAVPYTHPDEAVVLDRFHRVNKVAGILMEKGKFVFSPISHTHPIAKAHELPTGWEYWLTYDEVMLSRCQWVYVLMLDGWKESKGVTAEIKLAKKYDIGVVYINEQAEIQEISFDYTK